MNKLLVSISCLTYNHAPYIKQTIDGFLMQKTNFDFEILIHDDASNDGTAKIIQEYESKYPNLIKPIYQKENQWSKGVRSISAKYNFPRAKGKYIAMCEGDDYWTDPLKLQKQVDFLEENEDVSLAFHPVKVYYEANSKETTGFIKLNQRIYTGKEIIQNWTIPTVSVMFINKHFEIINLRLLNKDYIYGDIILFLSLAEYGKLYCLKDNMAIYRRHAEGITQKKEPLFLEKLYKHREAIANDFNGKYSFLKKEELSYAYFSLALNYIKKFKLKGVIFLLKSILFNPNAMFSYLKTKI